MATSAKRFGLPVKGDEETELRLRRIEAELERLVRIADLSGDDTTTTARTAEVPQVTGLSVTGKTPSAVTMSWNSVRISDLRRYELDVAEDLAFSTNKQTFNVAGTEYQFNTVSVSGGGGTIIYARVRARNRAGTAGPYSAILNTTTGQAQSADIADGAVTTIKIDPADPIEFAGLQDEDVGSKLALSGFINGLTLSNNSTDSDHDIDIASGVARDSTNVLSISNSSTITKQIDSSWASGSGSGGLASALSLSVSTAYFVFLLADSTGETVDAGFDTSPVAANLLNDTGDLSYFRRLGCVVTDASSNIYGFHQYGDFFQYNTPVKDPASYDKGTNPPNTEITHTLSLIPVGIECRVQMSLVWHSSTDTSWGGAVIYAGEYAPALSTAALFDDGGPDGSDSAYSLCVDVLVSDEGKFKTDQDSTHADLILKFMVHSWIDLRGKDGTT